MISEIWFVFAKGGDVKISYKFAYFWLGLKIKKKKRRKYIPENRNEVPHMLTY